MPTVGDVMSRTLVTVDPGSTLGEAATIMSQRRVGSALVLDGGTLVGIFTERDIVRALSQSADASRHEVGDWMTREPQTVTSEMGTDDAVTLMLDGGYRHLPVVDGDKLVGMVSMRDLARGDATP